MVNCSPFNWARSAFVFFALLSFSGFANDTTASLGFYYGTQLDVDDWQQFKQLVVQPNHITKSELQALKSSGVRPIAYLSLGEVANANPLQRKLAQSWLLGSNPDWQSRLLDLRNPDVQQWILDVRFQPLLERGFEGVFLDTVDSFHRLPEHTHAAFRTSIVAMVARMKQQLGNSRTLWVNRGFDMLVELAPSLSGIVFESLYRGYRNDNQSYVDVDESSRRWLLQQASKAQQLGLSVVAIDYLSDKAAGDALVWAEKIHQHGIQPFISDGHLTRIGSTTEIPIPRKILALHEVEPKDVDLNRVHLYATTPLEYLGYQLEYHAASEELPTESIIHRYAGIIVWPESGLKLKRWCPWLRQQAERGIKVAFLGVIPAQFDCHWVAGIAGDRQLVKDSLKVVSKADTVGAFEAPLVLRKSGLQVTQLHDASGSWLTLKIGENKETHPIAVTSLGGYAINPYVLSAADGKIDRWLFDPVLFFKQALDLPNIPAIDVTTETGQRILLAHIDGDGFVSKAEFYGEPLAAEVILKQVIQRYPIPHTVSVIEAEVAPHGVYPKLANTAQQLAREIFSQPNVEVASHTYSHPFYWRVLEGEASGNFRPYGTHLPVTNYQLNLSREVDQSIEFINQNLAPDNKQVKVFLWSGDARPGNNALTQVNKNGIWNVNGGNTRILPFRNSLTQVWPIGLERLSGTQIYAPVMNENVYTNEWNGPYYGYRQVIHSFKMLESPRRLKPINLYYHFYSGTKPEALSALKDAYDWAMAESTQPMYLSEYAARATAFYKARLTRDTQGYWRLYSPLPVRTLRLAANASAISGDEIAGSFLHQGQRYFHVAPSGVLKWQQPAQAESKLRLSRGTIILDRWRWETLNTKTAQANFSYHSWRKPEFWMESVSVCRVRFKNEELTFRGRDRVHLKLPWNLAEGVSLVCTR